MIIMDVQDFVFNISLRMLGMVADAQDASQEILIKIITNLSSFKGQSQFHTWVYRIAVNYLYDYKKTMFAAHPLDFDFYANDIRAGHLDNIDEIRLGVSQEEMAEELKLSCTNVMLQCLDTQSRCIFILGTMFKVNSQLASEILDISPESYRQKLSRARRKMATFLSENCGLCGGYCDCYKRVGYAIQQHRIDPLHQAFKQLERLDEELLKDYKETMEVIEDKMMLFETMPQYHIPQVSKQFITELISSKDMNKMKDYCGI
ncbi:MAG: RNA polymerase sigma factor [Coprobacillus sp.]